SLRLLIQLLLEAALALQKLGIRSFANVHPRFGEQVEQHSSAGPLVVRQGERVQALVRMLSVQGHQHVEIERVELLHGSEISGAKLVADQLGASGFGDLQRRLDALSGLKQIAAIAGDASHAMQRSLEAIAITGALGERQQLAIEKERAIFIPQIV